MTGLNTTLRKGAILALMSDQFNSLELKQELLNNLGELGFTKMTPIQQGTLPIILKKKDVIGQAKTGSGKTAAFGLGILNALDLSSTRTQALILCPTRELADQVASELRRLARMLKNVKILTICGGTGYFHQESSLRHGAHIIVGTPGRVYKLIKTEFIQTGQIRHLTLDEADRMLDMGFYDEIMNIEEMLPTRRQTLLFSATFPDEIIKLSENIQRGAEEVKIDTTHEKGNIEQFFFKLESHKEKNAAVLKILGRYKPERLIIFCKTKVITDNLTKFLKSHDIEAAGIHGDLDQNQRTLVLTKFAGKSLSILVATDVAARGLDIESLAAVINYDLPYEAEDYIHRVGRTGRAGKKGQAFSLFLEPEEYKVENIEEVTNDNFEVADISSLGETQEYQTYPPMKTIYISGGKKNKLRPGDILGALVKEANLDPSDVGNINILPILTYVAISKDKAHSAIKKLEHGKIKNRCFRVGFTN